MLWLFVCSFVILKTMKMVQYDHNDKMILHGKVMDGLLFIPDISGFTRLVHSFDVLTGKQITCELLSEVLGQNLLNLNLSEVEGDAVLFYRYGPAPTLNELVQQYNAMVQAFESKRAFLEKSLSQPLQLSLKVIAHYGPMTEYQIGPFKKLYGEVVVEAHRLLKNSIKRNSYLLLTDALIEQSGIGNPEAESYYGMASAKLCEIDGNKDICFTYAI
jgi:hypothetical protein